ncbi:aspartate/glutamate racemase family protein [Roseomonas sp. CAU 1739]|uniref:aspartate/glutamate racemase family protein n=1 Tax=Roseomonas sp. CAU 1739 TaxID=3140364 RepID=UPI00325B3AEA
MSRKAYGGKALYGARVGILMLDMAFPRVPGDTGNAETWPFPVLYKVVKGATAREVIHEKGGTLRQPFLDAAAELVSEGADGITTTGGFLSIFQKDLAAHVKVPVASSSLMQIPLVQSMLPLGKRVGILTVQGERLGPAHLRAIDVDPTTPIVGTENGTELTRVLLGNERELDCEAAEKDMLQATEELLRRHPETGAIVLECHNMAPYSRAVARTFRIPVYDVYTLVTWFHAGLSPCDFGPPATGPDYADRRAR